MTRFLSTLAVAAFVTGCAAHTSVTTAHTVGKGNFQGAIEPGVGAIPPITAPTFNAAFRYGVSEKVDIGFRFGTVSYELTTKYMFSDPESDGTVVSLAPATTFWFLSAGGAGGGFFRFDSPLLIGIPVGESQFIVGPNWSFWSTFAGGAGVSAGGFSMGPGAHLAYSAKMGDNFRLHPELSVKMPALISFASSSVGSSSGGSTAYPLVGFTLGFLFGGN